MRNNTSWVWFVCFGCFPLFCLVFFVYSFVFCFHLGLGFLVQRISKHESLYFICLTIVVWYCIFFQELQKLPGQNLLINSCRFLGWEWHPVLLRNSWVSGSLGYVCAFIFLIESVVTKMKDVG